MPARTRAGMSGKRPKATLVIMTSGTDEEDEEISVPVVVGRALCNLKRKGELKSVTHSELLSVLSETQRSCAKEKALAYLERRDLSKRELEQRLSKDGFPSFARDFAVEFAIRCKYIDDERYLQRFAQTKQDAGWGEIRIKRELRSRGIDVTEYDGWPEDYIDVNGERERAYTIALRKHVLEPNAYAKLVRFLLGRGFAYGVATSVAKEVLDCSGL